MDRIKSKNCGSRAWSEVILSQAQDLKTVRGYKKILRFAQSDISS